LPYIILGLNNWSSFVPCSYSQSGTRYMWGSWRIRDQLDVTIYSILFHYFYAQHVLDINTSLIRSLLLFYCITTLVVCSCFDVCWEFQCGWLGWYPCGRLKHNFQLCFSLCHTKTPNTHRNKNIQLMWWYNKKVAGSWWCMY